MSSMKVIDVIPKDITIRFEVNLSTVNLILDALDHSVVDLPADKQHCSDALMEFFTMLNTVAKELNNATP